MEFKIFAGIIAISVHKKAEWYMHLNDGDGHIDRNSDRGDSAQPSQNEPQASEELGADGQRRKRHRYLSLSEPAALGERGYAIGLAGAAILAVVVVT